MWYRSIREQVKNEIIEIQKRNPRFKPGLAIVQVGDRPDSSTYVRMKGKAAQEVTQIFCPLHRADRVH
jgi:methylenetetrahydrofolate dehydrogenase (NADP+)/methenyltetrahydrofolate cyclohydrolase/formyltetrahydrofolate synthetase